MRPAEPERPGPVQVVNELVIHVHLRDGGGKLAHAIAPYVSACTRCDRHCSSAAPKHQGCLDWTHRKSNFVAD